MATQEATTATTEAGKADATTENLDDVSPRSSSETESQDPPEYRADVGKGEWKAPPSKWKVGDSIYLRLKDGQVAGPFTIVLCHTPQNRDDKWRYDIKDAKGKTKARVSGSSFY